MDPSITHEGESDDFQALSSKMGTIKISDAASNAETSATTSSSSSSSTSSSNSSSSISSSSGSNSNDISSSTATSGHADQPTSGSSSSSSGKATKDKKKEKEKEKEKKQLLETKTATTSTASVTVPAAAAPTASHGNSTSTSTTADNDDNDDDDDDYNVFIPPDECQQIETGDSIKVKQVLDETVTQTLLWLRYERDYKWENRRLWLMFAACTFAMTAQFYPIPFPESRPLLGVCCVAYFAISGLLQYLVTFYDVNTIMTTVANETYNGELWIDTEFERFQEFFVFSVYDAPVPGKAVQNKLVEKMSVGRFFTEDGFYDEVGFAREIEQCLLRFQAKAKKEADKKNK